MKEEQWIHFKDFCSKEIELRKASFAIWDEVMDRKFGIVKPFKADIEKRMREHPGNEQPLSFAVQFHWRYENDSEPSLTCVTPLGEAQMECLEAGNLPLIS